jgi:hypothetical protein
MLVIACCYVVRSMLPSTPPRTRTLSRVVWLPHPVLCPLRRCAALHPPLHPLQLAAHVAQLLRTVHRRPPCAPSCCWGAANAIVPHQKIVATINVVVAAHDLGKEMLR